MPNKCSVVHCKGNYNVENKCRVFRIPKDICEQQKWMDVLPPRKNFVVNPANFFICEQHWEPNPPMTKLPGGSTRPSIPPKIFDVPNSCLPSAKSTPRNAKVEDRQLNYFLEKDNISSFDTFKPDRELLKKYKNLILSRSKDRFVCLFMTSEDYSECNLSLVVNNKATLCCPLTLNAFKNGNPVPLGKILHPNNGLKSYSQFHEAVRSALSYDIPFETKIRNVVTFLQAHTSECIDMKKEKKLSFLTRQLQLLTEKQFSMNDYCVALESYPKCSYEQLREFLVLPSKRKLQYITASIDRDHVLRETFSRIHTHQQKNVLLMVDEVQIRPTVAFSGGVLSGMAKNKPDCRATSMLCIMMKSLYRGPSLMISVTPVHKLTADYQFECVREATIAVENAGGCVLGSITDNHKVNQHYCKLFERSGGCNATASHPLDNKRPWFLLFDTVHLLKCIRNNWISEKCQKISLDNETIASFVDVKELYESEKYSILKTTPLTQFAVNPTRLQLQNVQHVLKVFNERVVAALKLRGCHATAKFIQTVLNWWNVVNVSAIGQNQRLNDLYRAVQDPQSTTLQTFLMIFQNAGSGHGPNRIQCFTHDTKNALVQTMVGLIAVCRYLLTNADFKYVLLREIQSDRLEGEFSIYRQSTGANSFMTTGEVFSSCKRRLTRYAAKYLQSIDVQSEPKKHDCMVTAIDLEDADAIERCVSYVTLTVNEEYSAAYVAGWLEMKCASTVNFSDDEPFVTSEVQDFIETVSRGSLKIPHLCTYDLVRCGLSFVQKTRHRVCCQKKLSEILRTLVTFTKMDIDCPKFFRRLANVLLSGLHNLEKDHQKNAILLQTSVKKARLAD